MATDVSLVIKNLLGFYDFCGKEIIAIGAGGGQLVEYGRIAKKVVAIDCDEIAVKNLKAAIGQKGLSNFEVVCGDFYDLKFHADVVLFEFCLHEMSDPTLAIRRAMEMASDIVIIDHVPDSDWAYFIVETEKAAKSAAAIKTFEIEKELRCEGVQFFKNYDEIFNKIKSQGSEAIKRVERFKEMSDFSIKMPYGLTWIKK